jgi:hypothetical protein
MTPREIIQAIKTSPIKERQAERNICDAVLNPLYDLQQICLNAINTLDSNIFVLLYSDDDGYKRREGFINEKKAYSDMFTEINKKVELLECYKENGNYGDLL